MNLIVYPRGVAAIVAVVLGVGCSPQAEALAPTREAQPVVHL